MDDRELLELAAKAAGLKADFTGAHILVSVMFRGHLENWDIWDPLEDDGDALRLAVTLGMKIVVALGCARVCCGEADIRESFPCTDKAGFRATRRAITRAAAAIGKAMP